MAALNKQPSSPPGAFQNPSCPLPFFVPSSGQWFLNSTFIQSSAAPSTRDIRDLNIPGFPPGPHTHDAAPADPNSPHLPQEHPGTTDTRTPPGALGNAPVHPWSSPQHLFVLVPFWCRGHHHSGPTSALARAEHEGAHWPAGFIRDTRRPAPKMSQTQVTRPPPQHRAQSCQALQPPDLWSPGRATPPLPWTCGLSRHPC